MRHRYHPPSPSRQLGATLLVAMIFLVILTLLGLSAMRVTTLEERMSGNARDHDLAFQAAESGLLSAEQYLYNSDGSVKSIGSFVPACTLGLCAQGSKPDWKTYDWAGGSSHVVATSTIFGLASQPRYFIESVGQTIVNSASVNAFRITVLGTGAKGTTVVTLEEVYVP